MHDEEMQHVIRFLLPIRELKEMALATQEETVSALVRRICFQTGDRKRDEREQCRLLFARDADLDPATIAYTSYSDEEEPIPLKGIEPLATLMNLPPDKVRLRFYLRACLSVSRRSRPISPRRQHGRRDA